MTLVDAFLIFAVAIAGGIVIPWVIREALYMADVADGCTCPDDRLHVRTCPLHGWTYD